MGAKRPLQLPVIRAGRFKDNQRIRLHSNPLQQLRMSGFPIQKLLVLTVCQTMSIKCVFGNVDANGIVHVSFPPCLVIRPKAQVSVQIVRKDEGDLTPPRSIMTERETIRPSPSPGINAVPDDGSCIAQEPRSG